MIPMSQHSLPYIDSYDLLIAPMLSTRRQNQTTANVTSSVAFKTHLRVAVDVKQATCKTLTMAKAALMSRLSPYWSREPAVGSVLI